jgi:hypothetical protein
MYGLTVYCNFLYMFHCLIAAVLSGPGGSFPGPSFFLSVSADPYVNRSVLQCVAGSCPAQIPPQTVALDGFRVYGPFSRFCFLTFEKIITKQVVDTLRA